LHCDKMDVELEKRKEDLKGRRRGTQPSNRRGKGNGLRKRFIRVGTIIYECHGLRAHY